MPPRALTLAASAQLAELLGLLLYLLGAPTLHAQPAPAPRPNILWITSEDNGPHLGCYGDPDAKTPRLDRLAKEGMLYRRAWSNAPVCAPARTALITGMDPCSTGGLHMRSSVPLPNDLHLYPHHLRQAGYFCINPGKTDYNHPAPDKLWDQAPKSGKNARLPWTELQRRQPFFAVINFMMTHESQIRARNHKPVHDPARIRIPAYHPDAPEVRKDWAQYHDNLSEMDAAAGGVLDELDASGLAPNTIVFYFADHGPGMPRSKRWPYDSGLRVPLIVRIPQALRHLAPPDYHPGAASDRLVGFTDFAPTLLSLADVKPPDYMQGVPFMGPHAGPPRAFLHGFRGRMDERPDSARSVTDGRYSYLRQFLPHLPYGQHVSYMFETPTTQTWKRLFDQGKLNPAQARFWQPKPAEELYDLQQDPDEVHNLAQDPAHRATLERLRAAQRAHAASIRDLGLLPESEMHARAGNDPPYVMGLNPQRFDFPRIAAAAQWASLPSPDNDPQPDALLNDADSAIRYWAAVGLRIRGPAAVASHAPALRKAMEDPSPAVRVAAAEALGCFGSDTDALAAAHTLLKIADMNHAGPYAAWEALNALEQMGPRAATVRDGIEQLPLKLKGLNERMSNYTDRLVEKLLSR